MQLTADQVYDRLLNVDQILTLHGQIKFFLGSVDIIVKQKDVVGNIMQEWIQGWMDSNNIEYRLNDNSQMPPDFYLNPADKTVDMLEIKAFNYQATPGFDIGSFSMFEREIRDNPCVLDTTYLIFGYIMDSTGQVTINKMWKKKVWEICRPMTTTGGVDWPLNLQIKDNVVHKIRPGSWYRNQTKWQIFRSEEDFLSAMEDAVYQDSDTRLDGPSWRQTLLKNYNSFFHRTPLIPRWGEIKDSYKVQRKPKAKKAKTVRLK